MLSVVAIPAATFFLNAVFAFAIADPGPRRSGRRSAKARSHLGVVLGWGTAVGLLLGFSTVVVVRWGLGWFALSLSIVLGIMMVFCVAVPSRLIGITTTRSRRDKFTAAAVGGALGAVVTAPPYLLGRVGILMLGSPAVHPRHHPALRRRDPGGRRGGRGQGGQGERQIGRRGSLRRWGSPRRRPTPRGNRHRNRVTPLETPPMPSMVPVTPVVYRGGCNRLQWNSPVSSLVLRTCGNWRRPRSPVQRDRDGTMESVTYEQLISDVAKGVEGVGAGIMVLGEHWRLANMRSRSCSRATQENGTGGSADSLGKRFSSASRCSSSVTSSAPSSSIRP